MSKIQGRTAAPGKGKENLLRLLEEAQSKSGYLSEEVITELARSVAMSVSDVYGVATFYSFLSTKPLGRNVVRICRSLPCHLKDSGMIIKSIEDELGIKPGETTPDGKFSLELTNCIGACDEAPAVLINNDVHGNLTPKKIIAILKSYK
ncbi:MAG: NADH-quinone oxidoreductase subunit NuoE [Chloroflexi bacterium]|nr:NADH-quinone oxidoreductase subunit NuoE [Chloroflexota bacterium]